MRSSGIGQPCRHTRLECESIAGLMLPVLLVEIFRFSIHCLPRTFGNLSPRILVDNIILATLQLPHLAWTAFA